MKLSNQLFIATVVLCMTLEGFAQTTDIPQTKEQNNTLLETENRDSPEMVPVSSTVIPVASVFGNPRPEATGTGELFPYFPIFTRRSRFFDKSSKPDTPVRLITKNSKSRLNGND